MSDQDQHKPEKATPYKLQQARKKGMVAKSPELGLVLSLACGLAYFFSKGQAMTAALLRLMSRIFSEAAYLRADQRALLSWSGEQVKDTVLLLAPLLAAILTGSLVASIAQVGLLFAPSAIKPDFSRLNPLQGVKRFFSSQLLIEALKASTKMVVYCVVALTAIVSTVRTLIQTPVSVSDLPRLLHYGAQQLLAYLLCAAILFAVIDQFLVRRLFAKKMRMSRHEVKQEFRQREGDPRIRQRRKQLQRELLQRAQSMRGMRRADVLVTNPTHLAVGLRYEASTMSAPVLVAKGAGDFAARLRRLAFVYGVPIVESKGLARQLYRNTPLESEISSDTYGDAAGIYLRLRARRYVDNRS